MDTALLDNKFARMGARLRIREEGAGDRWRRDLPLTLDVQKDDRGESRQRAGLYGVESLPD